MRKTTVSQFLEWVDSFLNFEKLPQKNMFWLDTMEFLCSRFDNPQNAAKCFHVAGSKGKGSVCAMISSILTSQGLKTGVYSSPHIEDFRERIRLNNDFFDEEIYAKAADELYSKFNLIKKELPQDRAVTWFELVTVYAFLCFRQAKVDESVFEVGLGGRLDATNVVQPQISVINTIELEHTEFLGDTIEKVAAEKAGIIKEGIPVLSAIQIPSVRKVFKEKAEEKHTEIFFADELLQDLNYCWNTENKTMNVKINSKIFSRPLNFDLHMTGSFQAYNAFLAAASVKLTHENISEDVIEKGLSNVSLPARFEIVKNPVNSECSIIIDGAHTVKSIGLTLDTLSSLFPECKADLVFACAADKDVNHIAKQFSGIFENVQLTKPGSTKSADVNKMIQAFKESEINFTYSDDYEKIISDAIKLSGKEKHNLLITGSFYLASEVKKILKTLIK